VNVIEILLDAAHKPMGITLGEIHSQPIEKLGKAIRVEKGNSIYPAFTVDVLV